MAANSPPLYLSESKTNEFFYTYTLTWSVSHLEQHRLLNLG